MKLNCHGLSKAKSMVSGLMIISPQIQQENRAKGKAAKACKFSLNKAQTHRRES